MAEAKAKLTLDATGATKGAKEFQNAADIIFNADKKAKAQLEKPAKTDAATRKAKSDLGGLAGDISRVTSVSAGMELALSKIGGGLKLAGVTALFGAAAQGIYTATMEARAFELQFEKIQRGNLGGVGNFGMSDLEGRLARINDELAKNKSATETRLATAGAVVSDYLANAGEVILGGQSKTTDEINSTRANRDQNLQRERVVALDRIADKEGEIWAIEAERILGNKTQTELMKIQAVYAERIQAATGSPKLIKQLNAEREALLAATKRQQGVALGERNTAESVAAMRTADAQGALSLSAQEEQRRANTTNILAAGLASQDADAAALASPKDPELATRAKVAAQEVVRLSAEAAKWERDIARSNSDSLKTSVAENEAKSLELRGLTIMAELTRQKAANELAVTQARRSGNLALSESIEKTGKLERMAIARKRVMDGDRVMRPSEARSRERQAQVDADYADRVAGRMEGAEGRVVARAGRSPRARSVKGAKFSTGGRDGQKAQSLGDLMMNRSGAINIPVELPGFVKDPGNVDTPISLFGGLDAFKKANKLSGENASSEMSYRQGSAWATAEAREAGTAASKSVVAAKDSAGGGRPPLETIATIMQKWDSN